MVSKPLPVAKTQCKRTGESKQITDPMMEISKGGDNDDVNKLPSLLVNIYVFPLFLTPLNVTFRRCK